MHRAVFDQAEPPAVAAGALMWLLYRPPLRPVAESLVFWPTDVLRPPTSLQERLAQRIAADTGADPVPPPPLQWREPEWEEVAPGIFCKLLATDTERHRVSMLVRLLPNGQVDTNFEPGQGCVPQFRMIRRLNDGTVALLGGSPDGTDDLTRLTLIGGDGIANGGPSGTVCARALAQPVESAAELRMHNANWGSLRISISLRAREKLVSSPSASASNPSLSSVQRFVRFRAVAMSARKSLNAAAVFSPRASSSQRVTSLPRTAAIPSGKGSPCFTSASKVLTRTSASRAEESRAAASRIAAFSRA